GNLCIGAEIPDPRYDARQLAGVLVAGLRAEG
ncbi:TetR family transcriptional regulator, partial [Streptomyces scabiei]